MRYMLLFYFFLDLLAPHKGFGITSFGFYLMYTLLCDISYKGSRQKEIGSITSFPSLQVMKECSFSPSKVNTIIRRVVMSTQ